MSNDNREYPYDGFAKESEEVLKSHNLPTNFSSRQAFLKGYEYHQQQLSQASVPTAKEYLQDKYPQMSGAKWNSNPNINDEWIALTMEEYAQLYHQQQSASKDAEMEELKKQIESLTKTK